MLTGRPQNNLPPQFYYNQKVSKQYANSTRIQTVQTQLAERALELLNLKSQPGSLILDIGSGSGLSGLVLSQAGFEWIGLDISRPMLQLSSQLEGSTGDLLQCDMGQGFRFRPGSFDGAISISAVQWLCVASKKSYNPFKRMLAFFSSLYNCLRMQGRVVIQFYPDGTEQLQMITTAAMKSGFSGGIVTDNPNSTKNKKIFLVLEAGGSRELNIVPVKGIQEQQDQQMQQKAEYNKRKRRIEKRRGKHTSGRQWVIAKRQRHKRKGVSVRHDSKYAGRRRRNFAV